ncbi:MAG: hypothetical protein KatS3mg011_2167 [Acidimicrobiia bacterium]|nr:MAG: hypothetical protein KatS3mg011_2167 [Acidimicrobiia bacterium]
MVAFVGDRARAVVDDPAYMAAVCLAAGVFCPPGPVWNHPDYEARVVELGLVVSSTTP